MAVFVSVPSLYHPVLLSQTWRFPQMPPLALCVLTLHPSFGHSYPPQPQEALCTDGSLISTRRPLSQGFRILRPATCYAPPPGCPQVPRAESGPTLASPSPSQPGPLFSPGTDDFSIDSIPGCKLGCEPFLFLSRFPGPVQSLRRQGGQEEMESRTQVERLL